MREVAETREAAEQAKRDAAETRAALLGLHEQMAEFSQFISLMRTGRQCGSTQ